MTEADFKNAPRIWTTTLMFSLTAAIALIGVPWYGLAHGFSPAAWLGFVVFVCANEMAITCGYHRLFSHATYEAHPILKVAYLLFGAMALQNSVLVWSAGHRVHHRYIDDPERDPYCAKRGFWFSHIGWMMHNYPSGKPDLSTVKDLQRDPLVALQHRYYLPIALAMNFGLPLGLGWLSGDIWGCLLLAGFMRLVVSHHMTFFINSLAHIVGTQPYTADNTSRDNAVVALLTFGEGYHNFHHMFESDYRNGVRWWQWDPSKWFIKAMSWCGLARNLKSVPWFRIQRALLDTQFRRAERQLARQPGGDRIDLLKRRIAEEYEEFQKVVGAWNQVREQWVQETRRAVAERWDRSVLQSRLKELEYTLHLQYRRMRTLRSELA